MNIADKISSINAALSHYMDSRGLHSLTADEAAEVVYAAGLISPSEGPPGAPGFAFRQYLRDLRDSFGYEALRRLTGVIQSGNRPSGRYVVHRFDPPSLVEIERILATASTEHLPQEARPSERADVLPDLLAENLDVVFVGTSVGSESARREHYYSNPTNKFWKLVNDAGLVSEIVGSGNDYLIVEDRCGLTDLVKKKVSSSDSKLDKSDFDVSGFISKMEMYKPKVIAFNGKRAYSEVFGTSPGYGLSDNVIGDSFVFVLPSSSGADASMKYSEKLEWYKKLRAFIRTI